MRSAGVRRGRAGLRGLRATARLLAAALALGAAPHAEGQSILQEWQGQPGLDEYAWFGTAIDLFRDVDGDGTRDLLVGAPAEDQARKRRSDGAVYVISGATGAVIRVHAGGPVDELGSDVAVLDDVDRDGIEDYAAIDGLLGKRDAVTVWSGASGAIVWRVVADPAISETYGPMLALLDDFNGDGLRDLGVAATRGGANPGSTLTILSAASGATIVDWKPTFPLGPVRSACRLDDVTGDGIAEFAVGHDWGTGRVEIVDGASLGVVGTLAGESSGDTFGDHCGQVGDLDGDGVRDLVVSDQNYGSIHWCDDGRVYLFSGATLAELFHLDPPGPSSFNGYGIVAEHSDFDFNADGFPDLAVGRVGPLPYCQVPPTGIDVWSGKSGRLLCSIPSVTAGDEGLGCALRYCDWNGDGFDDVVAGAFWNAAGLMSSGMVHVFSGNDLFLQMDQPTWYRYWAGDSIEATTLGGEPNEWMLLALVDVDGSPIFEQLALVPLDGFGESVIAGTVPPGLGGTTITLQAFATRPTRHGLAISDRVVVQFQ